MKTPVLLLVFNRPDVTARVFETIRAARPERLYVAADGARPDRPGEAERCAEVRRIATAVDWPCEVRTLFRDRNLGCKHGVAGGIDWFFEHEPEGIILEDDILPDPSFFPYCEALLERYRDDAGVAMISGSNLVGPLPEPDASYGFTLNLSIWGWASWRRAWQHYDIAMTAWPSPAARARVAAALGGRPLAIAYWSAIFDRMARGEIDTWDYQWVFSAWLHGMAGIVPARMLIENLGFGADATHTFGPPAAPLPPRQSIALPLHPPATRDTTAIDRLFERHWLKLSWAGRARTALAQVTPLRRVVRALRGRRG